jgi:UDP-3-O-[3-hydroxymyristoyl] glucosamine N-acyltransferase
MLAKSILNLTLAEITDQLGGRMIGGNDSVISGVAPFEDAREGDITMAVERKYLNQISQTGATAVLVPSQVDDTEKAQIVVEHPQAAFAKLLHLYYPPKARPSGISPRAIIGENFSPGRAVSVAPGVVIEDDVTLGDRVVLHPNVVIGRGVAIGDDVEIQANVTILENSVIGHRVFIQAGTVIGSDGFGFAPEGETYRKIPHNGYVQIDDDVEIGAQNAIDRGTFGKTWIQSGVKTDNLVHVAHNVTVGENTLLVAQVGISGSCTIGRHVILAGQAGLADHVTIGDNVIVGAQAGVGKDLPPGQVFFGSPTLPHRQWLRTQGIIAKLPELKRKLDKIEKRLEQLVSDPQND